MKKFFLGSLIVSIIALLCAGIVYVLLFMEEQPPAASSSQVESEAEPSREMPTLPPTEVKTNAETQADLLELLDYEIEQNADTVGWLEVPGTKINNSVVQSHDNNVYARLNERRQYDVYGCYYVDYECSVGAREDFSANTVIYGHSDLQDNPEGPRFSQLFHFTDPAFAEKTPVIYFSTMDGFYTWEVFAVFFTHIDFNFISANPQEGVDQLAAQAMEKSLYDYGVTVGPEDRILTLSTCTGKYGADDTDHRFVVMAKLMPADAEIPVAAMIQPRTPAES